MSIVQIARSLRARCMSVACHCVSWTGERRLLTVSGQNKMAAGTTGVLFARKEALNRLETSLKKFPPLLDRDFISCESEGKVSDEKTSEFRVLQWNVLADGRSKFTKARFKRRTFHVPNLMLLLST